VLARATERYTLLAQRADVDGAAGCLRVAGRARAALTDGERRRRLPADPTR